MLAVSRLVEMATGLNKADDAAHYAEALATYRSAWHTAFYSNKTAGSGCTVGGASVPDCHCTGKLSAVAMECEPSGHGVPPPTCGQSASTTLTLACAPNSGTIQNITFAAFGDIGGSCTSGFTASGCHSAATQKIIEAACIGKASCSIDASVAAVGGGIDPCPGKAKILAVTATGCDAASRPVPGPSPSTLSSYAGDTQTGNAMALYLDVPPTDAIRKSVVASLVADYRAAGDHPTFGAVGARVFLPVLAANDAMDVALDFATKTTQPSYGFMVATPDMPGTIWEQWGGDANNAAGSKNHPMFCGGIGVFLYQLAGLQRAHSLTDRLVEIKLDRAAVARVGAAEVSLTTPYGELRWDWEVLSGELTVRVSIPHGFKGGTLEIPIVATTSELVEGAATTVWSRNGDGGDPCNGVRAVMRTGSSVIVTIGAGEYRFRRR
jgi:hypothetical protein